MSEPKLRGLVAALAAVLVHAILAPSSPSLAADPVTESRAELARRHGGAAADFTPVRERQVGVDGAAWAAKLVDERTGRVHSVYRTSDGALVDGATMAATTAARLAARPVMERKADIALRQAIAGAAGQEKLPVAIWLDVDVAAAEAAVRAGHSDVDWIAGRPSSGTIEELRAIRGDLWTARREAYRAAADAFRPAIEAAGGSVAYASTSAPLVFVDLPAAAVEGIAGMGDVLSLGLEQQWRTSMSSAGTAVGANWTSGSGDQGNGVRVGVIEYHNASPTGDLAGQVVASYSTTGTVVTGIHPTWVAGAIASRSGTYAGVAPGADIVTAGTGGYGGGSVATDRAIIAAADWAVAPGGGDADILNASIGQDTVTGAEEARRYFDSVAWEDGRLVVAAAGNYVTFGNWDIVSPGTGYNVLTVGGINDRNTGGRGDDVVWYVPGTNGSNYRDRTDAPWNSHGDYNKPNLSAPAVNVRTANGTFGDGTSVASPIVAGIAAQLVARAPTLVAWPEATRAILMAGARHRTPMPNGSLNAGHEGAGTASALWSNRILVQGNGPYGGYRFGAMRSGQTIVQEVPVVARQKVRVALAWSSHTSGTSNTGKADTLTADLDLRIVSPNGSQVGSYSWDNAYEWVDLVAPTTGTMRIEIRHDRFDAAEEPYGLAWSLSSPFSDIGGSAFYADILWIAQQSITNGCGGGKYCPRSDVTREQMASFLVRALDLPATGTDYFADDETSQHEPDINALAAAGITLGCTDTRFCPSHDVTREQMATFLVRALEIAPTSTDHFTDDETSMHEAAINALASAGVTEGCGGGRYCPRDPVTREQMAAFLRRALAP